MMPILLAMDSDGNALEVTATTVSTRKCLDVREAAGATVLSGSKTVAVKDTGYALADSTACREVMLKANDSNGGIVKVGNATSRDYELTAGEELPAPLKVDDLATVYVESTVANDVVDYLGIV